MVVGGCPGRDSFTGLVSHVMLGKTRSASKYPTGATRAFRFDAALVTILAFDPVFLVRCVGGAEWSSPAAIRAMHHHFERGTLLGGYGISTGHGDVLLRFLSQEEVTSRRRSGSATDWAGERREQEGFMPIRLSESSRQST